MPNIHPLLVHFPIALIFAVIVIDFIGMLGKREGYLRAGTVLTLLALAGALAALITGLLAEDSVWHSAAADETIKRHEIVGFIYLGIVAALAIIRLAAARKLSGRLGWWTLAGAVVAAGVVAVGGYLGGELVFRYGTGVEGMQERSLQLDLEQDFTDDEEDAEDEEEEELEETE